MRINDKHIFSIYVCCLLAGIAVGFDLSIINRWMGRLYSVDKDHDINVLVLLSFQAAIAIDALEEYYQDYGVYPDDIELISIADYPDYVHDTFLSQYENHRFPTFSYSRQIDPGSVTSADYFTIIAKLGVDSLVYDSRQEEWRFFQRRLGPDGYLIPGEFIDLYADTMPSPGRRISIEASGHGDEVASPLRQHDHDAVLGDFVARENWISPTTGMEFVWIPQINMWVGMHEVTNEQYRKKVPEHDSGSFEGHTLNMDRQPVVHVSSDEIFAFASWLSDRDWRRGLLPSGFRYRLPSGEEWMSFAQCGDGSEYPWGKNWPPLHGQAGNYHGLEGAGSWGRIKGYNDGYPVTAQVDELCENPWGLKGVGGNVWEACADAYKSASGWHLTLRGASWSNFRYDYLRCKRQFTLWGGNGTYNNAGFRLVLAPE